LYIKKFKAIHVTTKIACIREKKEGKETWILTCAKPWRNCLYRSQSKN